MKVLLVTACFAIAAALLVRPLPRIIYTSRTNFPKFSIRPKRHSKMSFEEELQFIFNLKSQLHAGVTNVEALRFATQRAPQFAFVNTKQALASLVNVQPAMKQDAIDYQFPPLVSCANLLEISSNSGSSINEPLSQIAQSLITRRNQEQLIQAELASTKATMFVLAALPLVGAGMGLLLGTHSLSWLIGSTPGRVCLFLGLTLELAGWFWVKKLLGRALAENA